MTTPKNKEEAEKVLGGIKRTLRALLPDESRKVVEDLDSQVDNLQRIQHIVDGIIAYKEKLGGISKDNLNDSQKIWLLAHEASEKRIETSSKDQVMEDMLLLFKFIPDNEE